MTPALGQRVFDRLVQVDGLLVDAGFPPLSPWWRAQLQRFLVSGRRRFVLRVGRRGGKSTSLTRLAVCVALSGVVDVPPGEVCWLVFVSTTRDEASQRLRGIRAMLDALRVAHKSTAETIELEGVRIGFRVLTCSVGGVSGWTTGMIVADEAAKWTNADGVQNARDVLSALRPTMATQRNAIELLSSSPLGSNDAHAQAFDMGDTDHQLVAHAPTWVANPLLPEEVTKGLEPDERVWSREYAAIPQSGAHTAIDVEGLRACVRHLSPYAEPLEGAEIVIDASGGRHDAFVIAGFAWMLEPSSETEILWRPALDDQGNITASEATPMRDRLGNIIPNPKWHPPAPRLALLNMQSLEGAIARQYSTADVAGQIAWMARDVGACRVHGDQFASWSWESELARHGLRFEAHPWTQSSKSDAVIRLRQLVKERTLVIDPGLGLELEKLLDEARTFVETITPSGGISFGARGASKDDRIMTLLLGARCDAEGRLSGSPLRGPGRIDY